MRRRKTKKSRHETPQQRMLGEEKKFFRKMGAEQFNKTKRGEMNNAKTYYDSSRGHT